jgi:hypothetical protein
LGHHYHGVVLGLDYRLDFFVGVRSWIGIGVGLGKSVSNYDSFFGSTLFVDVLFFFYFFGVILSRVLIHVFVWNLMQG